MSVHVCVGHARQCTDDTVLAHAEDCGGGSYAMPDAVMNDTCATVLACDSHN